MSTRATYCFKDRDDQYATTTYVYIHYDGYLSGAAAYFYNTLCNPSKGNFATQFIRANPHAELTRHHDQHGDTEFKYDITGDDYSARVETHKIGLSGDWVCVFKGTILDLIGSHNDCIEDYKPFKTVKLQFGETVINSTVAISRVEQIFSTLLMILGDKNDYPQNMQNWNSYVRDAKIYLDAFPELKDSVPQWAKMSNTVENLWHILTGAKNFPEQ